MNTFVKVLLYPVWLLYGVAVFIRNKLYDFNVLQSQTFHLPVISVGNITVGGTGKTPHTEYLISLLKRDFKIAFLSRGYKRKTKDFIVATEQSSADVIGDEPLQVKRKFPDLTVAVDRNRVNGIKKLTENIPDLDIVLLDDAYQHRSVDPGINILLVDYNRPINEDTLLPVGRLREPASQKKRADVIIVTKVPRNLSPMNKRILVYNMEALPHQKIFFSTIKYGDLKPVFSGQKLTKSMNDIKNILLVTGIADPGSLVDYLTSMKKEVERVTFSDHHNFTSSDVASIIRRYDAIPGDSKIIITTEKDAARLSNDSLNVTENKPEAWAYLPIEIEFMPNEGESFDSYVLHYVKNNSRKSILYKK